MCALFLGHLRGDKKKKQMRSFWLSFMTHLIFLLIVELFFNLTNQSIKTTTAHVLADTKPRGGPPESEGPSYLCYLFAPVWSPPPPEKNARLSSCLMIHDVQGLIVNFICLLLGAE